MTASSIKVSRRSQQGDRLRHRVPETRAGRRARGARAALPEVPERHLQKCQSWHPECATTEGTTEELRTRRAPFVPVIMKMRISPLPSKGRRRCVLLDRHACVAGDDSQVQAARSSLIEDQDREPEPERPRNELRWRPTTHRRRTPRRRPPRPASEARCPCPTTTGGSRLQLGSGSSPQPSTGSGKMRQRRRTA